MASVSPSKSATTTRPSSSWQIPFKTRRPSHPQHPPPTSHSQTPHPQPIHPLLIDNDEALLTRAREFARAHMSHYDSSHDWSHIERVVALSRRIYAQLPRDMLEKRGYNTTLIELAALLHDICDHKYLDKTVALINGSPQLPASSQAQSQSQSQSQSQQPILPSQPPREQPAQDTGLSTSPGPDIADNPTENPTPSDPSAQTQPQIQSQPKPTQPAHPPAHPTTTAQPQTNTPAALLHQTLRNPPLLIPAALALPLEEIIQHVSYSTEVRSPAQVRAVLARHPELEIVQDADRLDALGAIGVGRCFTYGATRRCEAVRLLDPHAAASNSMEDSLAHFDDKLLRLEAMMKTPPGRKMARERSERIRTFKRWWQEEAGIVEYGIVNVSRK